MLELTLNLLPIALGLLVMIRSFKEYNRPRRSSDRALILLDGLAAFILVSAQMVWLYVNVILEVDVTLSIFSSIWALYNSLIMGILLIFVSPRKSYNKD